MVPKSAEKNITDVRCFSSKIQTHLEKTDSALSFYLHHILTKLAVFFLIWNFLKIKMKSS